MDETRLRQLIREEFMRILLSGSQPVQEAVSDDKAAYHDWPPVMGPADIAKILHIGISTARELMRRNDFPAIQKTPTRRVVLRKSFEEWLERSERGQHFALHSDQRAIGR